MSSFENPKSYKEKPRGELRDSLEKIPVLRGIPASSGIAKGLARVVRGSADEKNFKNKDVLVTRITDPTMVLMMNRASAIVCDIGGITSHPSILSRELGIPCVVNTKHATKTLKDGQTIIVNGNTGDIFLD